MEKLHTHVCYTSRFSVVFILRKVQFLLRKLNSFHLNTQFAFELEKKMIFYLTAFILQTDNNQIATKACWKKTKTNNHYLTWKKWDDTKSSETYEYSSFQQNTL